MMNKRAFTLMELLVAVFIGSMVTIALVSVWKGASLQTSQSQRQTVIRNNLSMFLRILHRDLTDSDVVIFPRVEGQSSGNTKLVVGKNALLTGTNTFKGRTSAGTVLSTQPRVIIYCVKDDQILREEEIISDNDTSIPTFLDSLGCSGQSVMNYVTGIKIDTKDAVNYTVSLQIHKDFADKTTPVQLDFEQIFTISGGG